MRRQRKIPVLGDYVANSVTDGQTDRQKNNDALAQGVLGVCLSIKM